MRNPAQKGSVLIVVLWAMIVLSLLAISGGRQVSMAIKMSRYREQKLEAYCRAKTILNTAAVQLEKDLSENEDDTLTEAWAAVKAENSPEISDEERRVNLNLASPELILALLGQCGVPLSKAQELAEDLMVWRGSRQASATLVNYYIANMGYSCKQGLLNVPEEIDLIKGFSDIGPDTAKRIRDCVTVLGAGKVNINTASGDVLSSLAASAVFLIQKSSPDIKIQDAASQNFTEAIMSQRARGVFLTRSQLSLEGIRMQFGFDEPAKDSRALIAQTLLSSQCLTTQSQFFRIEAVGAVGNIKRMAAVIYDRKAKQTRPVL